jgi:hypothetical protein
MQGLAATRPIVALMHPKRRRDFVKAYMRKCEQKERNSGHSAALLKNVQA